MNEQFKSYYPLIGWFFLTSFFFLHYFIRVSPNFINFALIQQYGISLKHIGWLSTAYFLTYTLAQIPIGYLLQRYSILHLTGIASILCGVSVLAIINSQSYYHVLIGYMCYAFFGAFALLGAISYVSLHITHKKAMLIGLTQAAGMAGGCMASYLISHELEFYPWQIVLEQFIWPMIFVGFIVLMMPQAKFSELSHSESATDRKKDLRSHIKIYQSSYTWVNALYAASIYSPFMLLTQSGIGKSMIQSIHGHSSLESGTALSMIFIGWMIGGPLFGYLSDRFAPVKMMKFAAFSSAILLLIILKAPLGLNHLMLVLFCFGLCNPGLISAYAYAATLHGREYASILVALTNMSAVLLGAVLSGILPNILEHMAHPDFIAGVPYYTAAAYQKVIGLPIMFSICCAYMSAYYLDRT